MSIPLMLRFRETLSATVRRLPRATTCTTSPLLSRSSTCPPSALAHRGRARQLCTKPTAPPAAEAAAEGKAAGAAAEAAAAAEASAAAEAAAAAAAQAAPAAGFSYVAFSKAYPVANNLIIATLKTGAADLVAQCVIERKTFDQVDWKRNMVFCLFGFCYLGIFQYWYQVNIFTRLFPGVNKFTSQPWSAKLTDGPGLLALGGQTILDLGTLSFVYLPTFYVFKAGVFSGNLDVQGWFQTGLGNYTQNLSKDCYDVVRVWGPADLLCFSVPLYLRLPVRHVVSFVWTAYLSFVRGGKK